jgi:enterochelin esterase-like enzyme
MPTNEPVGARRGARKGLLSPVLYAALACALALATAAAAATWQGLAAAVQQRQGVAPATTQGPAQVAAQTGAAAGRVEYGEFQSASLGRAVRYAVSLPPGYDEKPKQRYPLVLFLHGLNNSERDWEGQGIEAKLTALRATGRVGDFIVAVPYGANSFYLNSKDGTRYEDAIVKDFLPFVDAKYRTTADARHRLIAGLSMGGSGALLIAFKHPEMFAGVATNSAALFGELPKPPAPDDRRGGYYYALAVKLFGDPPDAAHFQANNPLYLAKTNADKLKHLKIYFDVGEQDRYGFDAGNRQLDAMLTAAGVKHEFHLVPGGHGWTFLAERAEPAFEFVWQTIR